MNPATPCLTFPRRQTTPEGEVWTVTVNLDGKSTQMSSVSLPRLRRKLLDKFNLPVDQLDRLFAGVA
jgi:hypothetical protein